jgi:hypothetical protein
MADRPRPLRVALAVLGSINTIAIATVPVLQGLGVVSMDPDTMGLVITLIGVTVNGIGSVFAAFYMEGQVTPISDPRAGSLVPLVPVAQDGLESA